MQHLAASQVKAPALDHSDFMRHFQGRGVAGDAVAA
jgi:hypothetical protein